MFNSIIFVSVLNIHSMKKQSIKGDPSDILQQFPSYTLQLHCCRYWWLEHWEFNELSYPYWRLYFNQNKGARITHNGVDYELNPDKIILIAPNTSYASRLFENEIPEKEYRLQGGRIDSEFPEEKAMLNNYIMHLFIHFNLGIPYDNISPGIYIHDLTSHMNEKIKIIKEHLNTDSQNFNFHTRLVVQSLIEELLINVPKNKWEAPTRDSRVLKVLHYIEQNIAGNLDNPCLAKIIKMAPNAFLRIFKNEMGIPLQYYVKKKRIDKACILLHHSNSTIEEIATQTGFADRYHFSRVFKQITKVSPAKYKKSFA
jgi:AraC-like DNA-binding protein